MFIHPLELAKKFVKENKERERYRRDRVTIIEAIQIARKETYYVRLGPELKQQIQEVREHYGEGMGSAYIRMTLTEFPYLLTWCKRLSLGHPLTKEEEKHLDNICSYDNHLNKY